MEEVMFGKCEKPIGGERRKNFSDTAINNLLSQQSFLAV
jgi:hypothetical protein